MFVLVVLRDVNVIGGIFVFLLAIFVFLVFSFLGRTRSIMLGRTQRSRGQRRTRRRAIITRPERTTRQRMAIQKKQH